MLSTKVPAGLRRKLERLANRRKVPVSVVVREALEKATAEDERRDSFTARAGEVIGCLEGPKDLSTHPKHMEGYGR